MDNLISLVKELITLPKETEWLEFKMNYADFDGIGEYISALSNSATYHNRGRAYLIWGIDDETHEIIGTDFNFSSEKIGNEELENWLRRLLSDNANFSVHTFEIDNKRVVMLDIFAAVYRTVRFKNIDYIRVGSYKKSLKDHPAMEVQLWQKISGAIFEELFARQELHFTEALNLLDYQPYFDMTKTIIPGSMEEILHYLMEDRIIVRQDNGLYAITNLGAVLFAKNMSVFPGITRKSVRVIQYKGTNRIDTIREEKLTKGYACGFEDLIRYVEGLLPKREEINGALRNNITVYPSIAVRELIANSLIHQDLAVTGAGPMIEIFSNRIEITNPGTPLIEIDRIIDNPPRSRNEALASLVRRTYICEERGVGWDRIVLNCELFHLPTPRIDVYADSTKVTLFSQIPYRDIPMADKIWSCYMHACLKQVNGGKMTNASLRERFNLPENNKSVISRLITVTVDAGFVKLQNPDTAPRYYCYIPFWG